MKYSLIFLNEKIKNKNNNLSYFKWLEEFKIDKNAKLPILQDIENYKFSIMSSNDEPDYNFLSLVGLAHSYIENF